MLRHGKFMCIAQFRHKATQSVLQEHKITLKKSSKTARNRRLIKQKTSKKLAKSEQVYKRQDNKSYIAAQNIDQSLKTASVKGRGEQKVPCAARLLAPLQVVLHIKAPPSVACPTTSTFGLTRSSGNQPSSRLVSLSHISTTETKSK